MISVAIAYLIAGVFAFVGLWAIGASFFDKAPDRANGFWGGLLFLGFAYLAAWIGGI